MLMTRLSPKRARFFALPILLAAALAVAAPKAARVGFYSGTFDPIHQSHLDVMEKAIEQLDLDEMVVVPNVSPNGKDQATAFDTRWSLVEEAIRNHPRLKLPPKDVLQSFEKFSSPTTQIAAWVKNTHPANSELFHVMGMDSFEKFRALPESQALIAGQGNRQIVVIERNGVKKPAGVNQLKGVQWIEAPVGQLSSTAYRADPLLGEAMLPPVVARRIKKDGLYGRGKERGFYDLPPAIVAQVEYEQRLNDRLEDTSKFASIKQNDLKEKYLPENRPTFYLSTVDVPASEVRTILTGGQLPPQVEFTKNGQKYVRFFIHPESEAFFKNALAAYPWKKEFLATPTSSHRSLIVWNPKTNDPPIGMKVSLNVNIGSSVRLLTQGQVERAAATSAAIHTIPEANLHAEGIHFIDEPAGVLLNNFAYGYSLRDIPTLPDGHELMPMFSLYSKPAGAEPPIVQMIRASGLTAREFAEHKLMRPLLRHAVHLALEHGLIGEPHEQNVLIEVAKGQPTGQFYYRDMAGFTISPELRAIKGKDMSFLPAGTSVKSLKMDRSDLLAQVETYIRHAQFYSIEKSLEPYFKDVTGNWINDTYRRIMAEELSKHVVVGAPTAAGLRSAMAGYMKQKARMPAAAKDCKGIIGQVLTGLN